MALDECAEHCSHVRLRHTPSMPWRGDLLIRRDVWATSDFACRYDAELEAATHDQLSADAWERIREHDQGRILEPVLPPTSDDSLSAAVPHPAPASPTVAAPLDAPACGTTPIITAPISTPPVSSAERLSVGLAMRVTPRCHTWPEATGPWSGQLREPMAAMALQHDCAIAPAPPRLGPVEGCLREDLMEAWTTKLLPRLHTVAELFGGRVCARTAIRRTQACARGDLVATMVKPLEMFLRSASTPGASAPSAVLVLLSSCLQLWSAPESSFGSAREHACAVFLEEATATEASRASVCSSDAPLPPPTTRFQLTRVTLTCEPGWGVCGWRFTSPTVTACLEHAVFSAAVLG